MDRLHEIVPVAVFEQVPRGAGANGVEDVGLSVALLCAIGGITAIIGSEAGLSVLIAGFWFATTALRDPDQGVPS